MLLVYYTQSVYLSANAVSRAHRVELNDRSILGECIQHICPPVILNELQIETAVTDTTQWTESRSLNYLVDFIVKGTFPYTPFLQNHQLPAMLPVLHKRLSQQPKSASAPNLLYVAGAALRVADVTRVPFRGR